MNSTYTGAVNKGTVFPSLLIKLMPVMLSVSSDSWSFAVLDASKTTVVFPLKVVPVPLLLPHPAAKNEASERASRGKDRNEREPRRLELEQKPGPIKFLLIGPIDRKESATLKISLKISF
jgi:hypothetical protein